MGRADVYREQAQHCALLLTRVRDPRRRALLEREREDWLVLASEEEILAQAEPASWAADADDRTCAG